MNILHLTRISTGGAFVAASRISESLNKIGHNSRVEVLQDFTNFGINSSRIESKIDFLNESGSSAFMTTSIFRSYSSSKKTIKGLNEVDVVNLHWIPGLLHQNFFNQIRNVKRVVWTMHDMNPFTGICHHADACRNFENSCNPCPQFVIPQLPIPAFLLKQKIGHLNQLAELSFIAPSEWLQRKATTSHLLRGRLIDYIPNPTSNDLFQREQDQMLKTELGLKNNKLIVGILGANYGVRKGGEKALEEIINFHKRTEIEIQIVIFGERYPGCQNLISVSTIDHPTVAFEDILQICDLYVHMSEYENLPNIIIEAQSLGVPVVALDRGGTAETVLAGVTGYVMRNESEFQQAMSWFLAASKDINLKNVIKSFAQTKFDQFKIANRYMEIYSK